MSSPVSSHRLQMPSVAYRSVLFEWEMPFGVEVVPDEWSTIARSSA